MQEIKKRLNEAEVKKNALLQELSSVQNSLNFTQGQHLDSVPYLDITELFEKHQTITQD